MNICKYKFQESNDIYMKRNTYYFYDISVNELYDRHATKDGLYITILQDYYNQTEFTINVVG